MEQYSLGAFKSPDDYRTIPYEAVLKAAPPASRPKKYRSKLPDVKRLNQRERGACTLHAVGHGAHYMERKETGRLVKLSPRYPYGLVKKEDGMTNDEGTYLSLAIKKFLQVGMPEERFLDNDTTLSHQDYINVSSITREGIENALIYAGKGFVSVNINNPEEIKQAIYREGWVAFASQVGGDEWYNPRRGRIELPSRIDGGHAYDLFGYEDKDDGDSDLDLLNSWDRSWADDGTATFSYNTHRPLIMECYTITDLPNDWIKKAKDLPPANEFHYTFVQPIRFGQTSDEVKQLQVALKIKKHFTYQFATGYYGALTQTAVKKYQLANIQRLMGKLKKTYGQVVALIESINGMEVGPATRELLTEDFR